ncbi:hypothetical protein MVEN_02204400 [Mycena venus]|uniref:Uncharacterized protein n=1 Tax=Mycena venus TaxID=2733690 RepID=A0A8H6X7N7_9AGAR|nr:hypothetical protein MVEN_02204400 [Mycena venus]
MADIAGSSSQTTLVWDFSVDPNGKISYCVVCRDGIPRNSDSEHKRHKQRASHKSLLEELSTRQAASEAERAANVPTEADIAQDGLRHLLLSLARGEVQPYPAAANQNILHPDSPPRAGIGINWDLMEANHEGDLSMSADERAVAFIAGNILERFDLPASDDELEERSDAEDSQSEDEPEVADAPKSGDSQSSDTFEPQPHKRGQTQDETATNRYWFPWPDRISCTLDILMHLPCSVFSQKQLDLFLWLLKVNEVDDVPSIKQMQKINLALQKVCGIQTISYNGALGNKYFVNNLAQIIAQEMANPRVRPHLSFYPEDSGPRLSEAHQGERWLKELPAEQTTPMLHISGHDYYIYELAMLDSDTGEFCIPIRWFTCGGEFLAKCWRLLPVTTDKGSDVFDPTTNQSTTWEYTNPVLGNHWRAKAEGARVVIFPMWVYCDDTSGNVSKKWNKHNSFLMTPAGLPREESQKEYNIHFLCTSNLARPLEMLDGIVDQLEKAQGEGIWVWDIELNEPVLVIPEVLALLGDNPMQSHDAMDGDDADEPVREKASNSDTGSVRSEGGRSVAGSSDEGSVAGSEKSAASAQGQAKKHQPAKRFRETMKEMVDRVRDFMTIKKLRHKAETTKTLRSFFTEASTKLDTKTSVKNSCTEHGLKDKFQMVFIDRLFDSYKKKCGAETKRAALEAAVASLPSNTMSPVWRIKGLDPHQDTPVEILHVVLLGFVKTLVQYSGSLTGRDFCAIAQVAPFVLYDLVSKECLETWQALSKVIPLIWQSEIDDIELHLELLTKEIDHFLLCAAQWTNCWFNKPKFHIFLHLPAHIRRFGPAILFATEAFESFNAVIRAKSVHSNRHAPSRDIALAFAQGNRIRHLLSGGLFILNTPALETSLDTPERLERQPANFMFSHDKSAWRTIGDGPKSLVSGHSTAAHYLGLEKKKEPVAGISVADKSVSRPVNRTLTGQHVPSWSTKPGLFKTNKQVYLGNGDVCAPLNYVIAKDPRYAGETYVARVEEIIQQVGSLAQLSSQPDGVLVQKVVVDHTRERYGMPSVQLCGEWLVHSVQDLLCTVNVQHNCLDNGCTATGSIPVFQERIKTSQTAARVTHVQNLDDVVLNTAQMRDAVHVQQFRLDSTPMDLEVIINASAAREIAIHKKQATAAAPAPPPRPRPSASAAASSSSASHLPPQVAELQFIHYPGHIP